MVKDYDRQILSDEAIKPAMVQVFLDAVGPSLTLVFVIFIMLSIFFCGSALTLAASRMVYAFSRDRAMPWSKHLHSLEKRTNNPVLAVWFNIAVAGTLYFPNHVLCYVQSGLIGDLPVIVGVLYMINSTAFEAIVSVNTIGAQSSYFIPILLRITVSRKTFKPGIV